MLQKLTFFKLLVAAVFILTVSFIANAQATRTWVSGVGDDANPCSRTAPCKTFAGAISKTATNGEINCLDPGGFGAVTLTKSITIDCRETLGGVLAASTNGVIINSVTAIVSLRGLDINGSNTGINGVRIISAASVTVEDSVIYGFTQNAISVENTGDVKVVVNNSTIRNNIGAGVAGEATGSADISIARSLFLGNGTAIIIGPNSVARISANTIVANTVGLSTHGRTARIISFQNNVIDGNGTNGSPTSTLPLQ